MIQKNKKKTSLKWCVCIYIYDILIKKLANLLIKEHECWWWCYDQEQQQLQGSKEETSTTLNKTTAIRTPPDHHRSARMTVPGSSPTSSTPENNQHHSTPVSVNEEPKAKQAVVPPSLSEVWPELVMVMRLMMLLRWVFEWVSGNLLALHDKLLPVVAPVVSMPLKVASWLCVSPSESTPALAPPEVVVVVLLDGNTCHFWGYINNK